MDFNRMWWDREEDRSGKPIRPDVRAAACEIWKYVQDRTRAVMGDAGDAAELLEHSVGQISRYLVIHRIPMYSRNLVLLMNVAFNRALRRRAFKLCRLETVV